MCQNTQVGCETCQFGPQIMSLFAYYIWDYSIESYTFTTTISLLGIKLLLYETLLYIVNSSQVMGIFPSFIF